MSFKGKAIKTVIFGVAGLAYVTNVKLSAEEKFSDFRNFVKIKNDTISVIHDNPFTTTEVNGNLGLSLAKATRAARNLVQQTLTVNSYPGIVVGVSIKGQPCWVQGFGFSDVESGVKCNKNTKMRIASISKPLTMAAVAKLVEEGKLDLDKSIYHYLGDKFPVKEIDGQKVTFNIRQLASHLAGIRHYHPGNEHIKLIKNYGKAIDATEIFAEDDLTAKPGTKFNYSTFGYTLIAAAVESVLPADKTFGSYLINDICRISLGMVDTFLDENSPIILNRAKQYIKEIGRLKNAPYVDVSYKYAGGGILSTVPDLLRFGNAMLYSYLPHLSDSPGFLKKSTIDELWTPAPIGAIKLSSNLFEWCKYGLGWGLIRDAKPICASGASPPFTDIIFHTGGATGGTTLLTIVPEKEMVIAIICNLEGARNLMDLGVKISEIFGDVPIKSTAIHISPIKKFKTYD